MSEPKSTVPKFASFRPKPTPPLSDANGPEDGKYRSRSKDRARDREEKGRRRNRHRSRSRSKTRGEHRTLDREKPPQSQRDISPEIFVIDRKGDTNNLVYGSIHRYSVPPFHRIGAGSVLGDTPDMKIERVGGDENSIAVSNRRDVKSNYREKYAFSKIENERPRLLKIRPEALVNDSIASELEYVPLQISKGKKHLRTASVEGESSDSDVSRMQYRSIHGKAKAKQQPPDDHFQYATESDLSGSEAGWTMELDVHVRQKSTQLAQRVEQFPNDIEGWLALIEYQDTLIIPDGRSRRITNAEMRSTADIKIHMYEKALERARSLKDRETLLLGLMAEGSKVWEAKTLSHRWDRISKDNIDSLLLWKNFLNFKQTTFTTFRYEDIREIYLKRIKYLSEASTSGTENANSSFSQQLLYVVLRCTIFVRESGYSELAVAIWQCILEFNLCPPSLAVSHSEKVLLFKEFWESEVQRIGEVGARGWYQFAASEEASAVPEALADQLDMPFDNKDIFKGWAGVERLRCRASRMPARTMDDVIEDDPFRVILFSDIEEFLVPLPTQSQDLQRSIINAFLLFCSLPPMTAVDQEISQSWLTESFIQGDLLEDDSEWTKRNPAPPTHSNDERNDADMLSVVNTPSQHFSSSPDSMFGDVWFRSLYVWRDQYSTDDGPVTYEWVRNTLKQLTHANFREDVAEYYLAFEWRNEPESIRSIAKSLLRQHPSNLRLYNAYAMIEWSRGKREVAIGVFNAALGMSRSMTENERQDSVFLWKGWTWGYLQHSNNTEALKLLLSITDGTAGDSVSVGAAIILRTRQYLSSNKDYLLSSGDTRHAIVYTECLALLEYLCSSSSTETQSSIQGDIASALSIYTAFSATLIARDLGNTNSHELLLQSASRLLFHHARIGPFRPALLRQHLTHFISLFPQNTIFLSLYTYNESRLRIENRVRTILLSTALTPDNDTITSRLFSIRYEIAHGTIYSVRSAFEHACSSLSCASSPGLWRFYVLYCLWTPKFTPDAKDIWFRALRACPWAKELYMLGFERMRDLVPFAELKNSWRVMGEKELRVHVDLEEIFEEMEEVDSRQRKGLGR